MKAFSINIIGLSNKAHRFDFAIEDEFLAHYGTEIVPGGNFSAEVVLDKHETFIEADFRIKGAAHLICDRSLESYDHRIDVHKKLMFKYGEEAREISDEIILITREQTDLEFGQLIYEFICVEIPMKRLHPRFTDVPDEEGEGDQGKIVYSSQRDADQAIDPRWEVLKKLK